MLFRVQFNYFNIRNLIFRFIINKSLHIKIFVFVLSSLMLFYSFGYIFVYWKLHKTFKQTGIGKIRELAVSKSIENYDFTSSDINTLPNKELLCLIKIHKNFTEKNSKNIQFIKDNEIRYFGEMFDIIKSQKIKDTVYYLCISDKNEDVLEKAFLEHFNNDNSTKSKNTPVKNIVKNLNFDGIILNNNLKIINIGTPCLFFRSNEFPIKNFFKVLTPPPENYIYC
ncbi:MAG: hypothetical protein V1773_10275 [bacterium]